MGLGVVLLLCFVVRAARGGAGGSSKQRRDLDTPVRIYVCAWLRGRM